MSMNHRRTILLSAILFSVGAAADPMLPVPAADGASLAAREQGVEAAPDNRVRPSPAVIGSAGEAPLMLLAETMLKLDDRVAVSSGGADDAASLPVSTRAEPKNPAGPDGKLHDWVALGPHLLDDQRGGFDTSLHLTLSFGIERAVYLNGALVTTTSFNLPALRGSGLDEVTALPGNGDGLAALPVSTVALLQNGPNNHFSGTSSGLPMASTVIQNTLNNQTIQNVTTINASANSLELLRANAFQNLLRDGIGHAVGPH